MALPQNTKGRSVSGVSPKRDVVGVQCDAVELEASGVGCSHSMCWMLTRRAFLEKRHHQAVERQVSRLDTPPFFAEASGVGS